MLIASWVVMAALIVAALVPPRLRVPRRRIAVGVIILLAVAGAILLRSYSVPKHRMTHRDLAVMVACFSALAALGFVLGAGTADKVLRWAQHTPPFVQAVLHVITTTALGTLFFASTWFLMLYYLNTVYLQVIKLLKFGV